MADESEKENAKPVYDIDFNGNVKIVGETIIFEIWRGEKRVCHIESNVKGGVMPTVVVGNGLAELKSWFRDDFLKIYKDELGGC